MGRISTPIPVKLVMPMLSAEPGLLDEAEQRLVEHWGAVDYSSARIPWGWGASPMYTTYYEPEFGTGLLRQFLSFTSLIDPGRLAEIKVTTNQLEESWARQGRRRINLDPGYVNEAKLVLATTKDYGHRIYIGQGIYAEVTLTWRDRDFRPWPWTYPDYQSEAYLQILRTIRANYVQQLRAAGLKPRTGRGA